MVAVAVATLGVAGVTAAGLGSDGEKGEPAFLAATVPPPPAPAETVIVAPIPSSSPSSFGSAPTTTPPPTAQLNNRSTTTPPPAKTFTATKLPAVTLRAGTTVALTLADNAEYRVRHRDYTARIEAIGSSSSSLDRADSSFTVRTGLGNSSCVSLESVNFPGYFLRHQNFELKLQRRDGSNLFDQDVTFCPVNIRSGAALVLRSINYPERFLVESGGRVVLRESGAAGALALVPRNAG
ncbi:AbfB domain-containing protein [Actinoplanes regularis]|uniref:AbfB domain-containing protein n=1 Tax=Actinoplanes regularis TaxID=52697 RepID=UPI0015C690F9|nr:AbfB domain-containing protein [Actinoplanes regularis]